MTFTSFLLQLGFNLLAYTLPFTGLVYLAVRFGIRHGFRDVHRAAGSKVVSLTGTEN